MKSFFLSELLLWVIILCSKNIIMILMICSLSEIGNGIKIKKTNTFVSLRKGVCYKIADTFSITAKAFENNMVYELLLKNYYIVLKNTFLKQ